MTIFSSDCEVLSAEFREIDIRVKQAD